MARGRHGHALSPGQGASYGEGLGRARPRVSRLDPFASPLTWVPTSRAPWRQLARHQKPGAVGRCQAGLRVGQRRGRRQSSAEWTAAIGSGMSIRRSCGGGRAWGHPDRFDSGRAGPIFPLCPAAAPRRTRPAKLAKRMKRRWRVVLLRAKGEILGTVEAPDVASAKAAAAVQFDLDEIQRNRIMVQELRLRVGGRMTDLLLQPTGNPSQYEVIEDGQIVGRIALFHALRDRRKPWIWSIDLAFSAGHERVHGFEATLRCRHAGVRPQLVRATRRLTGAPGEPNHRLRAEPSHART